MYLQLAENSKTNNMIENYTPVETNQGVMYVRNDLLSETTLAAGGRIKAFVGKIAGAGAASGIPIVSTAAGIAKKVIERAPENLDVKLKGAIQKFKAAQAAKKAAPVETTIIPEVVTAADVVKTSRTKSNLRTDESGSDLPTEEKTEETFYQKYRLPILIGGGIVVAGTLAYLLTRKKRR